MKSITEIIHPVKLLVGSHADTAQTGQGCFMNVIAYLNGEPQITDESPCVCYVMRPLLIYANDLFNNEERAHLVPFIERAMGSRTDDKVEISRRLALVVGFANKQAEYAKYAAEYAAKSAKYAESAAEYAAKSAKSAEYAKSAKYAAEYAAEYRQKTVQDLIDLFDQCLPNAAVPALEVSHRANAFVALRPNCSTTGE